MNATVKGNNVIDMQSIGCPPSLSKTRFVHSNLSSVSINLQWVDWRSAEKFLSEQQTRSFDQKLNADYQIWKAILSSSSLRSFSEAVKARRKMAQVSFKIRRSRRLVTREAVFAPWSKKQRILIFSLLAQTMNELEHWTSENHISCAKVRLWWAYRFSFPIVWQPELSWLLGVYPIFR